MSQETRFTLHAEQALLDRIARQVAEYEWPKTPAGAGWEMGVDPATLKYVAERWTHGFDWRVQEARLNELSHFKARVGAVDLHYVRIDATGPRTGVPVVLMHGWPGCFLEYIEVGRELARRGFDAVLVSLPGVGFSSAPDQVLGPRGVAALVHELMTRVLGHERYVAHGADWGSIIAGWLGFDHGQHCIGTHMTMASPKFVAGAASTEQEQQWLAGFRERFEDDGAYFRLQTSRPLTAGFALSNNPVGLLAWMLEKFAAWGDPAEGQKSAVYQTPERADRVLRNVMLYLVTNSVATSMWIYRGITTEGPPGYPGGKRVETPTAFAATRDPIFVPPPRSLVDKVYRVVRWTEFSAGGHFPGYDVPDALAADIAEFSANL
ncbi:epoxide hydrolase family protein [Ramlibacter rhizophilus]|nr:epoxide hydrolase [Ramlibacter rhizophilus]